MFLELYRRRSPADTIYYYQDRHECDFVVQRGTAVDSLYQVTWDMTDESTRQREINGIIEASRATSCRNLFIITADSEEQITADGMTVNVVAAWKWLLNR